MLKRILSFLIALVVMCTAMFMSSTTVVKAASTYYVDAINGNDTTGNGSSGNPWKTISKAAGVMQAGDTCKIRSGTYREMVTPANSGTPGAYITFEADTGAAVTINGADLVTSPWTVHSGNIYKTTAPLGVGDWKNQVFVDGVAMNLARWPNAGTDPMNPVFKTADAGSSNTKIVDSELTQPDGYWDGAAVVVGDKTRWALASATVSSYTAGQLNIANINTYGVGVENGHGSPYYVIGKLAALDSANEWYYDSTATTLYLQTPNSDNPANHTVEVKARTNAFDLTNKDYIRIKGIHLFACTLNTNSSNYCEIDGIDAKYVSHYELSHIGGSHQWWNSGIQLGGTYNVLKNSTVAYSPGSLVYIKGENNQVINNLTHDAAYGPAYTCNQANITVDGKGHLVSHNTLYNSGRAVIAGGPQNCRIQYNHGYNAMKLTDDGGFIYIANCEGYGTEVHHNYFHDGYKNPPYYVSGGIYFDFATENFKVFNNVIGNVNSFGVFFHHYNLFLHAYNNTFYNISKFKMKDDGGALDGYGVRVINNISYDALQIAPNFGIYEAHNFTAGDPLFVNAAGKDFHLQSTSTAKDAGAVIPGITDGYSGSAPDIGAYEYGGTGWTAGHNFSAPPNPNFTTTNIPYHTLLTNGFFERETGTLAGWTKTNAKTAAAERSGSGATSSRYAYTWGVKLGTGADGVEQTVTGLSPNTQYELRGFGRAAASGQTVRIGVKDYGGTETYQEVSSTAWTEKKIRFNTGAASTSAAIYVYKPTTGGYAYADDVTLVEVGPVYAPSNLASSATLSVDSTNGTNTADKAVDGIKNNNTSRWASENTAEPHWFQMDWTSNQVIGNVKVWSGNMSQAGWQIDDFEIQYWDGSAWQTAATVTDNTKDGYYGQYNDIVFPAVTTNKLRMYITDGTTQSSTGCRLFEIEAYSGQNLASSAILSVDSTGGTSTADKAVDGITNNNTSRWASESTAEPHWFQMDWTNNQVIGRVRVWSGNMSQAGWQIVDYQIQYWNGGTWQTAAAVTCNAQDGYSGLFNDIVFPAVTTNKLRLYITDGTIQQGYSNCRLFEIEAYEN